MEHSTNSTPSKAYPFRTRRQIAMQMQSDREFARKCLEIMLTRQAAKESGATVEGAMGWGSSDGSRIATPAQRIVDGLDTDGDWEEVFTILARYTKQLAQHFREQQLKANPALADVAALFGVSLTARASCDAEHTGPVLDVTAVELAGTIDAPASIAPILHCETVTCNAALQLNPVEAAAHDAVAPVPHPEATTCNLVAVESVTSEALPQLSAVNAVPCEAVAPVLHSPVERAIIGYLTRHERGTTTEIAERTRKDRGAVLEALRQMHEQGTVVRVGVGRGTFYSLPPDDAGSTTHQVRSGSRAR